MWKKCVLLATVQAKFSCHNFLIVKLDFFAPFPGDAV